MNQQTSKEETWKVFNLQTNTAAPQTVYVARNLKDLQKQAKFKKDELIVYDIPDKTKDREKVLRFVTEKSWANGICNLEEVYEFDGLHKKRTLFTQVEAKLCKEHNISLYINIRNLLQTNKRLFKRNRIEQIAQIAKKYKNTIYLYDPENSCEVGNVQIIAKAFNLL